MLCKNHPTMSYILNKTIVVLVIFAITMLNDLLAYYTINCKKRNCIWIFNENKIYIFFVIAGFLYSLDVLIILFFSYSHKNYEYIIFIFIFVWNLLFRLWNVYFKKKMLLIRRHVFKPVLNAIHVCEMVSLAIFSFTLHKHFAPTS